MPLSAADCPNVLPGQELHQSAGTAPGIKNEVKTEPGLRNVPAFYWVLKACLYSPQVPHFGEMMWGGHMALFFLSFFMGLQNGEHGQKGPYGFTKSRVIPHLSSCPIVVGTSLILRGQGAQCS